MYLGHAETEAHHFRPQTMAAENRKSVVKWLKGPETREGKMGMGMGIWKEDLGAHLYYHASSLLFSLLLTRIK